VIVPARLAVLLLLVVAGVLAALVLDEVAPALGDEDEALDEDEHPARASAATSALAATAAPVVLNFICAPGNCGLGAAVG
jgi:hypothetical protein